MPNCLARNIVGARVNDANFWLFASPEISIKIKKENMLRHPLGAVVPHVPARWTQSQSVLIAIEVKECLRRRPIPPNRQI